MGSEAETTSKTPKLALFQLPTHDSHTFPATPPHHTLASVPFLWEQEPGKPLPCSRISRDNSMVKCLELPPRLLITAEAKSNKDKIPSPTTVLEGPYNLGRSILESSSFRFLSRRRQGSFDFDGALSFRGSSPDRGLLLDGNSNISHCRKSDKGLFGSWRKRGTLGLVHRGSFVFSDNGEGGCVSGATRTSDKKGLSVATKSHFWASIYGAFKQVIPRKRKWRKDAL